MNIILLEDVRNLGKKGDTATVKDGYGRNLIAKKQAIEATAKAQNDLKLKKQYEEKMAAKRKAEAEELKDRLQGMVISVPVKVGKDGKLFGSVSTKEIADAFKNQLGIELDKKKIVLQEPLKAVGKYEVPIKLHPGVSTDLHIEVIGENNG